ncbi:DUF1345 domain-containing protein [Cellulosimicrobium cellulans]|uniref:DUF1345 domain-containing protein n=1 Tax=Cellulosimicrobium cellulans TaxID=1710 RepID=UPI0018841E2D|nr:DUF1345 domain-containing protein [Cellulosimicrobium cellulans]MBE9928203.1 DUF1345 domain-containing protein [Cellulosimicrobium cellulans]
MTRRPSTARPALRDRLVPESTRTLVSTVVALVTGPVVVLLAEGPLGLDDRTVPVAAGLLVWVVLAGLSCTLTCVAFAGRRGPELERALLRAHPDGRGRVRTLLLGGGSTAWSVQFAVMALLVGFALAQGVAWAAAPALTVLGVAVIVVSWVAVLVSHSVHYARRDVAAGDGLGFAFPGEGPRAYADYVYLAAGVSTTFSTADVTVLDSVTRRTVTTHAVVAFAFNAVIVALVVVVLVNA